MPRQFESRIDEACLQSFISKVFLQRFLECEEAEGDSGLVAAEDLWEIIPESAAYLGDELVAMPDRQRHYDAATILPAVLVTDPVRGRALADQLLALDPHEEDFEFTSYVRLRLQVGEEALVERPSHRLISDR